MARKFSRSLLNLGDQLTSLMRERLWLQVVIGMFLGVVTGIVIGPGFDLVPSQTSLLIANWVAFPGQLFLMAIQFVVIPLVVASVIRGICSGQGTENLGRLSGSTVTFFVGTTIVAVLIGVTIAILVGPGNYIDSTTMQSTLAETQADAAKAATLPGLADFPGVIVALFPRDPLTSFVSGNMLQIVITAAIIGIALLSLPLEQSRPLMDLLASIQAVCMVIVKWVLRFAPLAVFGLLAEITAKVGIGTLLGMGIYVLVAVAGLLLLFVIYLLIGWAVSGSSPFKLMGQMREVLLLAFSTSSSAAVMPLTLSTVEEKLGVPSFIARFVVPLGTTINMGGTAIYQGIATIFLAQVFNVEIGLAGILLVVVMATGAAIGSPGTPGVGIVILATILSTVGIPAAGIAIIIGVDRPLDMLRTIVNVTGDMVACLVMKRFVRH
ncbi:MAG: dicarboxylate/amino acid:cation symporter [Gammaproteobacteria bacterium]|nr:dicarboxylate/amino acid:cation symporter [Gammaproteobacteria bacterium]